LSQRQNQNHHEAQFPSTKSFDESEQAHPASHDNKLVQDGISEIQIKANEFKDPRSNKATRNDQQLNDLYAPERVSYKLHTIQSLVNENDYSSNGGLGQATTTQSNIQNAVLSNTGTIENARDNEKTEKRSPAKDQLAIGSKKSDNEHSSEDLEQ